MTEIKITIKTYEYRLRPNKKFVGECERVLDSCRFLYNCLLEQRISHYRATGKGINKFEQSRQITEARNEFEELANVGRTIQTDVLDRLDKAYQAFFARGGFPRFKGKDRYHTFSQQIEKQRACPLRGDKLHVPSVGTCRVRLSRELPEGARVKQLRITRRASGWYALLVIETPKETPLPKTGQSVGVDVGVKDFCTLSNGEAIANPKHLAKCADKLAKLQRNASKKKKGSANRKKAVRKVALAHETVANARKDFHHKVALDLVRRFDVIAVEALNIRGMVRNRKLSKAILDVAWSSFFSITECKAGSAGKRFEKVDPRFTSQTCSKCGHRQKMPLKIRIFDCENCNHSQDRDENAAINILGKGIAEVTLGEIRDSVYANQEQVLLERLKRATGHCESSLKSRLTPNKYKLIDE